MSASKWIEKAMKHLVEAFSIEQRRKAVSRKDLTNDRTLQYELNSAKVYALLSIAKSLKDIAEEER
tara:strand:- start:191 stop:388 length:198 start_codon:yes stop_codon:yes gene_type:complete